MYEFHIVCKLFDRILLQMLVYAASVTVLSNQCINCVSQCQTVDVCLYARTLMEEQLQCWKPSLRNNNMFSVVKATIYCCKHH